MKKALFALGLLAFAVLPAWRGGEGDCCRKEVQGKSHEKS